jgi:PAS domain S-box-containing protein
VGIGRDITERKQAEEALARERIMLRTLIDNLPDAIYVKDAETRKVLVNPADVRNMGLQAEAEVLGKTDWELFPPEVAAGFYADDQAVLQTGTPVLDREELLVNTSGQQRWLLTSKLPLRDGSGQITGLVGIGHDISERRQMFESAQRYARRLEALHKIDAAILGARPEQEIAEAVWQHIRQVVPCTGTGIVTFDLDAGEATLLATHTDVRTEVQAGARFPLQQGAELQALRQGQVLVLDDVTRVLQSPSAVQAAGVRSCILAPLRVHDELTGALILTAGDQAAFASEHMEIAREVANQIAVAMQNARLHAALDAERRRLKTVLDNMPEGILL